jgi:hypothetical protein
VGGAVQPIPPWELPQLEWELSHSALPYSHLAFNIRQTCLICRSLTFNLFFIVVKCIVHGMTILTIFRCPLYGIEYSKWCATMTKVYCLIIPTQNLVIIKQ